MLGTIVVMATLGALSLDLFLSVSWLGLIVIIGLTAPLATAPEWRRRLKWFVAAGLVLFGLVVVRRIVKLLPSELVERLMSEILAMGLLP